MKFGRPDYNARILDTSNVIASDEPVFLIRGKDKCAPKIIRAWAEEAKHQGASAITINLALQQARAIEDWQQKNDIQVPSADSC